MKFEKVESNTEKRNGEMINLLTAFMESDCEVAEVKDWNDSYSTFGSLYNACTNVAKRYFPDKIKVSKCGQHLFLKKESV